MPKYKWDNPTEWLSEQIDSCENFHELRSYANALLSLVDNDQIQDLFQAEMDADGYFAEVAED